MSTPHLLTSVAEATEHRDRDDLDQSVARLMLKFLDANEVTLVRLITDGGTRRLQRRVQISRERGLMAPAAPEDVASLPDLTHVPPYRDCVTHNAVTQCPTDDGRSLTLFPIHGEREVVGLLVIDASTPLAARDVDLVSSILRIISNHLALLEYGERDTLTGLLNRRTFEARFEKLRRRLTATADPAQVSNWLALMDVDQFKSINDRYGHLFGDEVLLLISHLMRRNFRGADHLYRFGGEEFLIVLEGVSEAGAGIAFERLRLGIEAYDFPQVGRVTISLGFTRIDPQDVTTTCVERADAALYYAKGIGRNCVRGYETLIATGQLVAKRQSEDVELFE